MVPFLHKGAFIIYLKVGAMIILMGCTLFPYYDLGELWKIPNENDIEHRGGQPFFPEKENMRLDALIIPGFYFISTKC